MNIFKTPLQIYAKQACGLFFVSSSDVFLYALSHDDSPSLLISVVLLLLLGSCQERRWGSVAFLLLSILTITMLAFIYTLVLFVVGGDASRICGFSAIQLALFTAQCRQATQRRLLRCLPVWFLPWLFLISGLLLLPGTPALLHLCAICIGHNCILSCVCNLQMLVRTGTSYKPEVLVCMFFLIFCLMWFLCDLDIFLCVTCFLLRPFLILGSQHIFVEF